MTDQEKRQIPEPQKSSYVVEMLPAIMWTCEKCGRDVAGRCLVIPQDGKGKLAKGWGMIPPESVTCPYCNIEYETAMFPVTLGREGKDDPDNEE